MDDGATPVEHGGAPVPAQFSEFHKFSSKLLCLMSAFQHQNFIFFRNLWSICKIWCTYMYCQFCSHSNLRNPERRDFSRLHLKYCMPRKSSKNAFFVDIQISAKIELRVVWTWYAHQNDGMNNTITMQKFLVWVRTSGTPEISANALHGKIAFFCTWSENGARRALLRAITKLFLSHPLIYFLSYILMGMPSSYDT